MILVVDNYDSFTYNLVHLVEERVPALEVRLNDRVSVEDVAAMSPEAILISPGPGRPGEAGAAAAVIEAFGETTPILGVCLGLQAIAEVFGASLVEAPRPMHGKTSAISHDDEGVFAGLPQGFMAMRYHSLVVAPGSVPEALRVTATAEDGDIMGLRHRVFPVEGVQFHPESILSPQGPTLVSNWLDTVMRFGARRQRGGQAFAPGIPLGGGQTPGPSPWKGEVAELRSSKVDGGWYNGSPTPSASVLRTSAAPPKRGSDSVARGEAG